MCCNLLNLNTFSNVQDFPITNNIIFESTEFVNAFTPKLMPGAIVRIPVLSFHALPMLLMKIKCV
jgi:hypothetical protein